MAQLFRKSAIERLSSPEQLDKSIVITSPLSYVSLFALVLIMASFVVWSFFGTLPSTINVKGVVSNGICANSFCSEVGGRVDLLYVKEGDVVEEGDRIAAIIDATGKTCELYSHEAFVVTEITAEENMKINPSDELMKISPLSDNDSFIVAYLDIENAARVKRGMEVVVNISGFPNKKYGHAIAEVVNVDRFATSEENIERIVGNEKLIQYITEKNMPVCAVSCKITKDENSLNGWYWTNKNGESIPVINGFIADVQIITAKDAPISRLLPMYSDKEEQ